MEKRKQKQIFWLANKIKSANNKCKLLLILLLFFNHVFLF